jgi:hypothetical protein
VSDWYFIITQAAAGSIWNTLKGLALGSERFKDEIEAALHRKVRPGKARRLVKKTEECNVNFSLTFISFLFRYFVPTGTFSAC